MTASKSDVEELKEWFDLGNNDDNVLDIEQGIIVHWNSEIQSFDLEK